MKSPLWERHFSPRAPGFQRHWREGPRDSSVMATLYVTKIGPAPWKGFGNAPIKLEYKTNWTRISSPAISNASKPLGSKSSGCARACRIVAADCGPTEFETSRDLGHTTVRFQRTAKVMPKSEPERDVSGLDNRSAQIRKPWQLQIYGAGGGTRTRTEVALQRILSPLPAYLFGLGRALIVGN